MKLTETLIKENVLFKTLSEAQSYLDTINDGHIVFINTKNDVLITQNDTIVAYVTNTNVEVLI